jgi:hypothetical protein
VKVGDLVRTTDYGPPDKVGQIGIVIGLKRMGWLVQFGSDSILYARDGLEVISESR